MSYLFGYIHFAYLLVTLIVGFSAFSDTSFGISVSLILSPLIAWFGGSGLRGCFNIGNKNQIIIGIVLGIICCLISYFWISSTNYVIQIFGYTFSGVEWIIIGFLVGFIFSTKKHSLGDF